MGFHISDKAVKRAGLDYWPRLDKHTYINFDDFKEKNPEARISAAIVLFEALRQNDFLGLEKNGELHELSWKR